LSDNGCGFDTEELKKIPRSPNASIGLRNTRKRIRLYHGAGYGMRVRSGTGAGCTVTISIPVLTEPCD
jgi:sensor histidine kinase YesM